MTDHPTDPLASSAEGIIAHMNEDHTDALAVYAQVRGSIVLEEPIMTRINTHGFAVEGMDPQGERQEIWIAFPEPCRSPGDVRKQLVLMVRADREALEQPS